MKVRQRLSHLLLLFFSSIQMITAGISEEGDGRDNNNFDLKTTSYDVYSPYQYPWMMLNYFVLLWIVSSVIKYCLDNYKGSNSTISSLTENQKRNIVTYVIEIVGTSLALYTQIYGGVDILFRLKNETTRHRVEMTILSLYMVVVIYIWEIIYRFRTGSALLLHHIITLLLIQLCLASFSDTENLSILRIGTTLLLHATTEQLSFVALLFYRLGLFPKYHNLLFVSSAVQVFLAKTTVMVFSGWLYYRTIFHEFEYDNEFWETFWKYTFAPIVLVLYGAQLYAIRVLYLLGHRQPKTKVVRSIDRPIDEESNDVSKDLTYSLIPIIN